MLAHPTARVVFRADGNMTVGLGHVVRCQALAQALQPRFAATFVLRNPVPALSQQLQCLQFLSMYHWDYPRLTG
jgi:spore coat polysaccharide biosynthesis predicted glycosyltransferase SpsG